MISINQRMYQYNPSLQLDFNCEIDIYHIKDRQFKMVLSPVFDLQSQIFKKLYMQNF